MQITAAEDRPPYVTFEKRAIEDREASIEAGHYVAKDVVYAIITPAGSRDRIERLASSWFAKMRKEVSNGRFPSKWLDAYEDMFKRWEKNEEIPLEGTPLVNWPGLSPAQHMTLKGIGILTVEDLANANEDAISILGIGGRALKGRAAAFLSVATDQNKIAEELSALQIKVKELEKDNSELRQTLTEAQKVIQNLQPNGKPGKPQRPDSDDDVGALIK